MTSFRSSIASEPKCTGRYAGQPANTPARASFALVTLGLTSLMGIQKPGVTSDIGFFSLGSVAETV